MMTFAKIILINCFLWKGIFAPAPIFNLQNCEGGCKSQDDCPTNSACIPVIGQTCGLCLCTVGYTLQNGVCVASAAPSEGGFGQRVPPKTRPSDENGNGQSVDKPGDNGGGSASLPATTSQVIAVTPGASTAQSTAAQSSANEDNSGDQSSTFDCNRYKCDGQGSRDSKDCPDTVPSSIQCPNLAGGGQCMLGSCLRVNATLSYCMCPYGRQSRTCHVQKTGNCNNADGKLPPAATEAKGKRFRHIRDPENGAVLARHLVDNLSDCVRLCQWATYQQCRSINFGSINGQKTCELLTVFASGDSILIKWLKDDPDWTYVCCFK